MNSPFFINTNPIYSPRDFLPARAGTHFGRPYWSVLGSGLVCPVSAGCRLRLSERDCCRQAFMPGEPKPASSNPRDRRGLKHFWSHRACLGYGSVSIPPKKGLVPHSSGWWDV